MSSRKSKHDWSDYRVLLYSKDPIDSRWLKQLLLGARARGVSNWGVFHVRRVDRISGALRLLSHEKFDAILLDLGLPNSDALAVPVALLHAAPKLPIVILTGLRDESLALKAMRCGVQDYLIKDGLNSESLSGAIRRAIERKNIDADDVRSREPASYAAEIAVRQTEVAADHFKPIPRPRKRRIRYDAAPVSDEEKQRSWTEEFTYTIAHDLREPLRGVSSYCEMLFEDYGAQLDETGNRRLKSLIDVCDRLENMINDLAYLCRVGKEEFTTTTVDLNAVAFDVLKMLTPALERRRCRVKLHESLPEVKGNPRLLGVILSNLVVNGMKYNENETPFIEIGVCENATFFVRDNGLGIDPEHHDVIFRMFRRLHSRKKYEGSGAGLAIVKKLVDLHGGRVWLDSKPGRGSIFYVSLPHVSTAQPEDDVVGRPHWSESPCGEQTYSADPLKDAAKAPPTLALPPAFLRQEASSRAPVALDLLDRPSPS